MAKSKTQETRRSRRKQKADADAQQALGFLPFLVDGNSGQQLRLLDIKDLFAIEMTTGTVVLVAKDRVSNYFRKHGKDIKFADRGYDHPPENSENYVTIEEVEELTEHLEEGTARDEAQAALTEDERRADAKPPEMPRYSDQPDPVRP